MKTFITSVLFLLAFGGMSNAAQLQSKPSPSVPKTTPDGRRVITAPGGIWDGECIKCGSVEIAATLRCPDCPFYCSFCGATYSNKDHHFMGFTPITKPSTYPNKERRQWYWSVKLIETSFGTEDMAIGGIRDSVRAPEFADKSDFWLKDIIREIKEREKPSGLTLQRFKELLGTEDYQNFEKALDELAQEVRGKESTIVLDIENDPVAARQKWLPFFEGFEERKRNLFRSLRDKGRIDFLDGMLR